MDIGALKNLIRAIPDYPTVGVTFRDITPLLSHPNAFSSCIDLLAERFTDQSIDLVIGVEARGFILGAPMAVALGAGFIPVRKAGKLPRAVVREEYDLEYGSDKLEIHRDAIQPAQRVLIVDDVLATGGTAVSTGSSYNVLACATGANFWVAENDGTCEGLRSQVTITVSPAAISSNSRRTVRRIW